MALDRQNILGVGISAINKEMAIEQITGWILSRDSQYVCVTPAHSVMDCYSSAKLKKIFNQSGMTTPDGMAIVWLLRLYGHKHVSRVYGPDLLLALCKEGLGRGWRHYFYGSTPEVVDGLIVELENQFPGMECVGSFSPPFRPLTEKEKTKVVSEINRSEADIVWVGLGTPKQEIWMAEFTELLEASTLIGVGAAFDFISGKKPQAPKWIQNAGMEWLFRLITEPGRLWRRYVQYPKFAFLVATQYFGVLKFEEQD